MNFTMHWLLRLIFLAWLPIGLASAQTVNPPPDELFADQQVGRIDILLPADSLAWLLDSVNLEANHHLRATFLFHNGNVADTVQEVGFRLRGNTSRNAFKKSFKVSFNTYRQGRKYRGLEKLNLNGEHNDPSVSRAKICWDLARRIGLPASRSNPVQLFINGDYFGLYLNVEHIDEVFVKQRFGNKDGNLYKCLWPADLVYKGSDPDLYKEEFWGRRAYDLKTNQEEDDYTDLANFIDLLNNTPDEELACELEAVFHVDQYLKAIVFDILTGNWDGPVYNKNNFYLYHNLATGQFEYIPYDLDNTLGISWFGPDWSTHHIYGWAHPSEPRPIYRRLMNVPEYKDRFSFYLSQALDIFSTNAMASYLDSLQNLIRPFVVSDPYYSQDYGFTIADFDNSFEMDLDYPHIVYGIKAYIENRHSSAVAQMQLNDISPVITDVVHNQPTSQQAVEIRAWVVDDHHISSVEFCYFTSSPSDTECVPMTSNGGSEFTALLPPFNETATLTYYIQATDNVSQEARYPRCAYQSLLVRAANVTVAINELLASNASINEDGNGEYDDWVELYNYGTTAVYLGDKFLSDNAANPVKWQLPDTHIQPGQYLLIWADGDTLQGDHHASFKLSAAGEYIGIFDDAAAGHALIDGLSFGPQTTDISYGRLPNGSGVFQLMTPTPAASNRPLAVHEGAQNTLKLLLYPNPAHEQLRLEYQPGSFRQASLSLIDVLGKVVFRQIINGAESYRKDAHSIDMRQLPAGIYFYRLCNDQQLLASGKVVKQ